MQGVYLYLHHRSLQMCNAEAIHAQVFNHTKYKESAKPCVVKSSSDVARRSGVSVRSGSLNSRIEFVSPHEPLPHDPASGPSRPGSPGSSSNGRPPSDPASQHGSEIGSAPVRPLGMPGDPPAELKGIFEKALAYVSPEGSHPLGRDKSVFNSGGDDPFESADTFAAKNKLSSFGETFKGFNENDGYEVGIADIYLKYLSAAFGRASSGEVRVFLPKEGLTSDTTWSTIEWPELVENGQVTKITWIDPDDESVNKVIWKSGDGQGAFPLNKAPSAMGDGN